MINDFIYDIPVRIYFGRDHLKHLGAELKKYGTRVLMTYGGGSIKKMGLYNRVVKEIKEAGLELFELSGIEPNPRIGSVRKGVQLCKEHNIDVLLAVGGGSTIDATKIMAAGACVDHDPWDFLDLSKRAPIERALPIVSILTLAATGSEMGRARSMGARLLRSRTSQGSWSTQAPAAMILVASMVEPPPTASSTSMLCSLQSCTPLRTEPMRGLGSMPESSNNSSPASFISFPHGHTVPSS